MGFEPTYEGFANLCLTTWLPRRRKGQNVYPLARATASHRAGPPQTRDAARFRQRPPLVLNASAMSSPWMRKSTWAAVAVVAFGVGAAVIHVLAEGRLPRSPRPRRTTSCRGRATRSSRSRRRSRRSATARSRSRGWRSPAARDGCPAAGCGATGRYVGVRVSAPARASSGRSSASTRRTARRRRRPTLVAIPDDPRFLLMWLASRSGAAPGTVYSARIAAGGARRRRGRRRRVRAARRGHPVGVCSSRSPSTSDARGSRARDVARRCPLLAARRRLGEAGRVQPGRCRRMRRRSRRASSSGRRQTRRDRARTQIDPDGPVRDDPVSLLDEHVAREAPTCFVTIADVVVVYGLGERTHDAVRRRSPTRGIVDSLVLARSRDGGRNLLARASFRRPSHFLRPTSSTTTSPSRSSPSPAARPTTPTARRASCAQRRRPNAEGLTRTVVAPVTMVVSRRTRRLDGRCSGSRRRAASSGRRSPTTGRRVARRARARPLTLQP